MNDDYDEQQIRLLLVEDDIEAGSSMKAMLEKRGVAVELVERADRALDQFSAEVCDVIVADIRLEDRSGMELLGEIRKQSHSFPVILLTGFDSMESAIQAVRLGAQDYILKPLSSIDDLLKPVEKAVREHRMLMRNRALEQKLKESELRFRDVLENSVDICFRLNLEEKRIDYISPACQNTVGYTPDHIKSLNLSEMRNMLHPDDERVAGRIVETLRECAPGRGAVQPMECRLRCSDGSYRWMSVTWSAIRGKNNLLKAVVGNARDITEQQAMESQLRQSQKLESLGTLAGGVAHEINNPVNGIMNYAQLILDELGPGSPVSEYAAEICKETERVAVVVRNLLSFARQDKEAHSPACMCDIVDATTSLVRTVLRRDQIRLDVDVPKDLPKIKCRSQQIQQVVMNLLTNACHALNEKYPGYHENKKIVISATSVTRPDLVPHPSPLYLRLTVEDHGTGMSQEVQSRMFDPFYTTKSRDEGTGLGLSISHGIVKDHDGELSVESEPGNWTRFHVDLPVDNGWAIGN
jgi:PAS domain S-box-containing protein